MNAEIDLNDIIDKMKKILISVSNSKKTQSLLLITELLAELVETRDNLDEMFDDDKCAFFS